MGAMGVPAAARDWVLHGTQGGGGTVGGEEDEEDAEEGFEDEEGGEYGFYEDGAYEGDVLDVDNMSYEVRPGNSLPLQHELRREHAGFGQHESRGTP